MKNIHERRESEYRQITKELSDLYTASRNLGLIKLDKPIRDGWIKYLVLRKDVSRRKDANVFQNIIDVGGHEMWGRTKKKLDKNWEKYMQKSRCVSRPGIIKMNSKTYEELEFKSKNLFKQVLRVTKWGYEIVSYHCTAPPYFFKVAYRKAYLTHRHIIDPELNSRIAELENKLNHTPYYNINQREFGYGSSHWIKKHAHRVERRKVGMLLNIEEADQFDEKRFSEANLSVGWW